MQTLWFLSSRLVKGIPVVLAIVVLDFFRSISRWRSGGGVMAARAVPPDEIFPAAAPGRLGSISR